MLYQIVSGTLYEIEEFHTPVQTAVSKRSVCSVIGYDLEDPLDFETIPEKEEPAGQIGELHFMDGVLVWVYVDRPLSEITQLRQDLTKKEAEITQLKQDTADNTLMILELYEAQLPPA